MITRQKLDRLAELKAEQTVLNIRKQELIDGVLTPEIRAQIADIEAEFSPQLEAASNKESDLTKEIKEEVIGLGETVKGSFLQAVFVNGRTSWDNKGLAGYATAHPEINRFKKQGDPSVSVRHVK